MTPETIDIATRICGAVIMFCIGRWTYQPKRRFIQMATRLQDAEVKILQQQVHIDKLVERDANNALELQKQINQYDYLRMHTETARHYTELGREEMAREIKCQQAKNSHNPAVNITIDNKTGRCTFDE